MFCKRTFILMALLLSLVQPALCAPEPTSEQESFEEEDVFEEFEEPEHQETPSPDPIAQAEFFDTSKLDPIEVTSKYAVGVILVTAGLDGFGAMVTQNLSAQDYLWISGTYGSKTPLFLKSTSSKNVTFAFEREKRFQVFAGYDRVFRASQNWGFILGAGLGLEYAEYRNRYYQNICGLYCGFDPSHYRDQTGTDFLGVLLGRTGVEFTDVRVWNSEANLRIMMNVQPLTTPRYQFTDAEGVTFEETIRGNLVVELTIAI